VKDICDFLRQDWIWINIFVEIGSGHDQDSCLNKKSSTLKNILQITYLIYFASRHEVHSTNTHCLHNAAVMCPNHFCRVRVISNFFESSQSRVMAWSSRVKDESQELSNHFESLFCKLDSVSNQMKFHIFSVTVLCFEMAPDKLENDAQHAMNKCPIS